MRAVCGLLLAILVSSATATEPQPLHRLEVIENEASYPVDGTSVAALRRQLDERRRSGASWHGLTATVLDVRAEFEPTADGCRTRALEVRVEVTIWLPAWKPRGRVSDELRARWDAMLAGLRRHEDGHRRHMLDAANALYLELAELPTAKACASMEDDMRRRTARSRTRLQVKSSGYDALTGYGVRQGAQL